MIEKIYKNKYMVICDNCGEGQEFDTWTDALEYMFEEGWKKKLVNGEWEHYCPECLESDRVGVHVGLYCADCGTWQKWLNKQEYRLFKRFQEVNEHDQR